MEQIAWLLATSTTEGVRNPADALKAALKAAQLTDSNDPTVLDTLAEAYFINGKVDDAIATQRKAVSLAPDKKEYQEHLDRLMRGTKQISN